MKYPHIKSVYTVISDYVCIFLYYKAKVEQYICTNRHSTSGANNQAFPGTDQSEESSSGHSPFYEKL